MMDNTFHKLKDEYSRLWTSMKERDANWTSKITTASSRILTGKNTYKIVEAHTGVPWFVVGIIHQMESDCNFDAHLHNGDPLTEFTENIPAGRPIGAGDPPFSWTESAIDAIRYDKIDSVPVWSIDHLAFIFERFNGFRTRAQGVNTPYLWSGTNHYDKGKYVRDNVWNSTFVSQQVGCMPILARLIGLDASVKATVEASSTRPKFPDAKIPTPTDIDDLTADILDLKAVQAQLKAEPLYGDAIDGLFGRNTRSAIRALLVKEDVFDWPNWDDKRLYIAAKQALCKRDGIAIGEIDGILGARTKWALGVYACRKSSTPATVGQCENWRDIAESINKPNPQDHTTKQKNWPTQEEIRSGNSKFGRIGENHIKLVLPYTMKIAWDPRKTVKSIIVNAAIHEAVERVLLKTLNHYGLKDIQKLRLDLFGGCYNPRLITGGTEWSMHAFAAALDFDPDQNSYKTRAPKAQFSNRIYDKWWDFWEDEGAVSLGRLRDYDWMHVQFARLA